MSLLSRIADGADRLVRRICEAVAWLGLALVLLIAFNVFARYLFSYGSVALQEMEWHLMAVLALFGMPYVINRGEEVRVDVLYAHFPARTKRVVNAVGDLLLAAVALFTLWLSLKFVAQSFTLGEGSADPGGLPDRWILKAAIPTAFALLAIQAVARFILDVAGRPYPVAPAHLES
ncbi:TRAP transporter small permease subunit [Aurantimonas sp. MSK8Z-1]|uniref:TRAP transporter small permease subunit n=1 Tax=Mangrovibrevibacter kandeliae TaxID=2968473 RepID=UPI002117497F|nr:TRAP transporter small permease subunit [Aurantimonas sp. MSK8Z-1]MCW4114859.1 TRAP transporter small permease subunit [Aurantimonas sp. MSK8Z-1]